MSGREIRLISEGHHFLEGPRWHEGALFASDMFGLRVLKFVPNTRVEEVCPVNSQPSGLGWDQNGQLLISSMLNRQVLLLQNCELKVHADLSALVPGEVNDLLGDERGGVYVGNFGFAPGDDPAATNLVYVSADGTARTVADDLVFPNGMVITPDGRTLVVAETFAHRLTAFDIADDGSLFNRRVWASFGEPPSNVDMGAAAASGNVLPDGICLDSAGAIWVADAGGQGVLRVAEGGEVLEHISISGETAYAVALGGENGRTLFMCVGAALGTVDLSVERRGRLLACEVSVPSA